MEFIEEGEVKILSVRVDWKKSLQQGYVRAANSVQPLKCPSCQSVFSVECTVVHISHDQERFTKRDES